jgi:Cd2+/Zn2+-exporting ATPase
MAGDRSSRSGQSGTATPEESGDVVGRRFDVPGMDCPSCAGKVETALDGVAGVQSVETRPATGRVTARYDTGVTDSATLAAAIERAGYEVRDGAGGEPGDRPEAVWRSRRGLRTWASGFFLAAGLAVALLFPGANVRVGTVLGSPHALADVLYLFGVATGGEIILRDGYRSARSRSLDMDFLMSAAIAGAVTASLVFAEPLYLEGATLAFLVNVAELLERHSMDRARTSLRELMDLSPDEATVRRSGEGPTPRGEDAGGEPVTVPVEDVRVGDVVLVSPGEKIPVDGRVVAGDSAVNQAPVTGESVPVDKTEGEEVYAGSINETGYLEVETTAAAGDDTLSRVIELVADAESERSDREQFVDRFASYYTPLVVGAAVLAAVGPPLFLGGVWHVWFVRGLTLLVLACPCAFVISTPVSVVSGITSAARHGVLVKGGSHLEAMGDLEAVALDKTGTLTTGDLTVTDVLPLGDNTEAEVLRCARGLEARSEHPIGEAIVDRAAAESVGSRDVTEFESITGKGVRATLDGRPHYAGKPALFAQLGFDLSHVHAATDGGAVTARSRDRCERTDCLDLLGDVVPRLQAQGKTVVLVGTETELEGIVAVADSVRPEAAVAVRRLRELGVEEVVMLTGDNERTARAIAETVGIDAFRAELLPGEKVSAVESLQSEYDGVAMVGDGINDAPALATATVGIGMGAAGTDTALETADVALLGDDLSKLPYLRALSARASGVIRQNVWSSLGAKALLACLVPFGYVPIWLAVLVGDAGMTVAVTGNAMRLSGLAPEGPSTDGT